MVIRSRYRYEVEDFTGKTLLFPGNHGISTHEYWEIYINGRLQISTSYHINRIRLSNVQKVKLGVTEIKYGYHIVFEEWHHNDEIIIIGNMSFVHG